MLVNWLKLVLATMIQISTISGAGRLGVEEATNGVLEEIEG